MRSLFSFIALLLVACGTPQTTDRILADVWQRDQAIRHRMMELTRAVTVEGRMELVDSLLATNEAVDRIDAENMAVVDSLLAEGLPEGLSSDSYKTIWIVIDHASQEKQEQYLPLVEQMAEEEKISQDEYATLFDRVAMKQNRPQRYGTQSVQFGAPEAMQLYLWPVECPAKLDSLRASVGLSPIAAYLEVLTQTTGVEAKFDPQITIEELNALREE